MINGTKEDGLQEQTVKSLDGIARANINQNHSYRQPLRGISAFERLKAEWTCANPSHTEAELLAACVVFARACGLILREKVLQQQMREVGSHGTK